MTVFPEEPIFIDPDMDDQADRPYWVIRNCPAGDSCSANAWKRAGCFSYISAEIAVLRCKEHLMKSGLHALDEEAAITLAEASMIDEVNETYIERQAYAKQCRIGKEEPQPEDDIEKGHSGKAKSHGGKGKSHDSKGKGWEEDKETGKDGDKVSR